MIVPPPNNQLFPFRQIPEWIPIQSQLETHTGDQKVKLHDLTSWMDSTLMFASVGTRANHVIELQAASRLS